MEQAVCRARAERRREQRFATEVSATLNWEGTSQPVQIRNISIYGALVSGAWLPVVGERVTLIADYLEVCGTVIWNGPDRCGLLLSHAVDPQAIVCQADHQVSVESSALTLQEVSPGHYA